MPQVVAAGYVGAQCVPVPGVNQQQRTAPVSSGGWREQVCATFQDAQAWPAGLLSAVISSADRGTASTVTLMTGDLSLFEALSRWAKALRDSRPMPQVAHSLGGTVWPLFVTVMSKASLSMYSLWSWPLEKVNCCPWMLEMRMVVPLCVLSHNLVAGTSMGSMDRLPQRLNQQLAARDPSVESDKQTVAMGSPFHPRETSVSLIPRPCEGVVRER